MKLEINPANARGHFDHGWLQTWHSFSFSQYFNRNKMNFGALRVLNDDIVQAGRGFGMHPHDNMEIITIPLRGTLKHQDSLGSEGLIKKGEIQYMSAGTGIIHSEFNPSDSEPVSLYQIWIIPKIRNTKPKYAQMDLSKKDFINELVPVVSPGNIENTIQINQDAYIYIGKYEKSKTFEYTLNNSNNGVFLMVTEGNLKIDEVELKSRDAIGISETNNFNVEIIDTTDLILLEVPLNI